MNLPPLAEYFTHIQTGTEAKAANLSYSLYTPDTSSSTGKCSTRDGKVSEALWGFPEENNRGGSAGNPQ